MTSVRKAYQRAVVTPTHQVEQLWKDYENFENSVSRALVIRPLTLEFKLKLRVRLSINSLALMTNYLKAVNFEM